MTDGQSEQLAAQSALTGHLGPADRDPVLRRKRAMAALVDRLSRIADELVVLGENRAAHRLLAVRDGLSED